MQAKGFQDLKPVVPQAGLPRRETQNPKPVTRILGVDSSLRSSGVAMIEARGSELKPVEYGLITNPAGRPLSKCLDHLYREITASIARGHPDAAAIEGVFYCKNVRTAVVLGEARGAVIAACASSGVPVYEYPPRRVKQAVVGFGGAGKEQMRKMVMTLLGLKDEPQEDASDALAIAICHAHSVTRWAGQNMKRI